MQTANMSSIPAKANPFNHDAFHMGTQIGKNCIIMHANHDHEQCNYLIICNTDTGERMKVYVTDMLSKASSSERLADLINSI